MNKYIVTMQDRSNGALWSFVCEAENEAHALEQAIAGHYDAEPIAVGERLPEAEQPV